MKDYGARRVLVTGGRDWQDTEVIKNALSDHVSNINGDVVVLGGCPTGADAIAEDLCRAYGIEVEKYPAMWDEHGKRAGPIRNQFMVSKGADICLVFNTGGRGTRDCWTRAARAGIPVIVYTEKENE